MEKRTSKGPGNRIGKAPRAGLLVGMAMAGLAACGGGTDADFLGSAIVEAQTFQVTSLVQGSLTDVYKQEGETVQAGELLAVADTVPYTLQLRETRGGLVELASGKSARANEIKAAQAEIRSLERDYARIAPLVKDGSLPSQQEEKLAAALEAAHPKLAAARDMLAGLEGRRESLEARLEQIREQISRCYLRSPSDGRVLTRYRNASEAVAPGQPVFEIGREDSLQADFFVPQTWLAGIRPGQEVRLRLDAPGGSGDGLFLPATISWIGQDAEFSPRNIQTRESRNELVFRVRAIAANKDGMLKRGLPVEVWK